MLFESPTITATLTPTRAVVRVRGVAYPDAAIGDRDQCRASVMAAARQIEAEAQMQRDRALMSDAARLFTWARESERR